MTKKVTTEKKQHFLNLFMGITFAGIAVVWVAATFLFLGKGGVVLNGNVMFTIQIVVGILGFLAGLGMDFKKGICPHCGESFTNRKGKAFDCPTCNERIVVKDGKMYTLEDFKNESKQR